MGFLFGPLSCEEVPDIDRTQPDKIAKCTFFVEGCDSERPLAERTPREYYFNTTVIEVPASSDVAFVGDTNHQMTNRVEFDIQEDYLYVYRAQPWLTATDPEQVNRGDDYVRPGVGDEASGAPVAIFPIERHFDVQRDYNPTTGEQTNVIAENSSDRPWYERAYMRVDWSRNMVGDINFSMTSAKADAVRVIPQEDGSRDLGKERTIIGEDYIDFVQHIALEASTIPGSEAWYGFPVPSCWLFNRSHSDCQGGVAKVRYSFAAVPETTNYVPLAYDDRRLNEFGAFRTERYTYDDEYGLVEPSVLRLANRWNILKEGASCLRPDADQPYADCGVEDYRSIVYYVSEDHPEHLRAPAVAIGDAWNQVFREAVSGASGLAEAALADHRFVTVCPHNPVEAGDPAECGEPGLNPQIGDIRYSFNYYVPEQQESSPLGFGPANVDPITGQIVSASAYFYGAPARWLARRTLDLFKVQEGMATEMDIADGALVRAGVPEPKAAFALGTDRYRRIDRERVRQTVQQLDLVNKARRLAYNVRSGAGAHDEAAARLARLKQSGLDQLAVTDEMKRAFERGTEGVDTRTLGQAGNVSHYLSEAFFGLQRERERFLRHGPGGRHVHLASDYLEERYLGLFAEIRERFVDDAGQLDEAAALDYVEGRAFIDTQLHEMGHTLGMMHNFAGSTDAVNFGPEYWRLRAAGGLAEGKRPALEFELQDPDAYREALEQGLRALQSSSSMEYMSTYGTDLEPGRYDVAWVKAVYLDTVEVFDTEHPDVNITPERAQLFERGALHYTYYPELVSDAATYEARVAALYRRKNVAYRAAEADEGLVRVPYRFCGDNYVAGAQDCERWDQGVDAYERVMKHAADYQNYYWYNAFRRDRLAFGSDVYAYVSRLYQRTFRPMISQYKHWVNEELIVRDDEPCVWWEDGARRSAPDRFVAPACGLAGYAASVETLNTLARVINTPDVGCYTRLKTGCYLTPTANLDRDGMGALSNITRIDADPSVCADPSGAVDPSLRQALGVNDVAYLRIDRNAPYRKVDDMDACPRDEEGAPVFSAMDKISGEVITAEPIEIGLGEGKPSRTEYDRERYGYNFYWKPTVMGSWWEKWMAVKALSDPYTNFIGVDASADASSYLISMSTLFGDVVNDVVSGAVAEQPELYARVLAAGEVQDVPAISLYQRGPFEPNRSRNPSIEPGQEYTFRMMAMLNTAFQSSYVTDDYAFAEGLAVKRSFSQSDIELPEDLAEARLVSVRDPATAETWWAVRWQSGEGDSGPYSLAYEMLRDIKRRYYAGGEDGPGLELRAGVPEWQPRGELRFLNIMRGAAEVFGDAVVGSGDLGVR